MSESDAHAALIWATLGVIRRRFDGTPLAIRADVPQTGDFAATFAIGGFRPDVYVKQTGHGIVVIGEAKTARDIDNLHTRTQFKEFLEHLCTVPDGTLWVSVPLQRAGEALRVLRGVRREAKAEKVKLIVSGWLIGKQSIERRWHA